MGHGRIGLIVEPSSPGCQYSLSTVWYFGYCRELSPPRARPLETGVFLPHRAQCQGYPCAWTACPPGLALEWPWKKNAAPSGFRAVPSGCRAAQSVRDRPRQGLNTGSPLALGGSLPMAPPRELAGRTAGNPKPGHWPTTLQRCASCDRPKSALSDAHSPPKVHVRPLTLDNYKSEPPRPRREYVDQ